MATQYPNALDNFVNPLGNQSTASPPHDLQHTNANQAIEAIEAFIGTSSSPGPAFSGYQPKGAYVAQVAAPTGVAATDQATIQNALNALPSTGGIVQLQAGTYNLGGLTITYPVGVNNITLRGVGPATVISTTLTSSNFISWANGTSGNVTEAFTLACTGTGGCTGLYTNVNTDYRIKINVTGTFGQGVLAYQGSGGDIDLIADTVGITSGSTPGDVLNISGATCGKAKVVARNCKQDAVYVNSGCDDWDVNVATVGSPEGVQVRVNCKNIRVTGAISVTGSSTVSSFGVDVDSSCTDISIDCNIEGVTGTAAPSAAIQINTDCKRVRTDGTVSGTFQKGIVVISISGHGCTGLDLGGTITGTSSYGVQIGQYDTSATEPNRVRAKVSNGADGGILIQASHTQVYGSAGNCANNGLAIGADYCEVKGHYCNNTGDGVVINGGHHSTFAGVVATGNSSHGINEYTASGSDYNTIIGCEATGNSDATADIVLIGSHSKVAYCQGRYTQQGAA